jgi:ABC transporter substrate binding protein (PQQ-dependent alcohol dehydrogenase system)
MNKLISAISLILSLSLMSLEALAQLQPVTPPAATSPDKKIAIGFLELKDDVRYEPVRAYERLILKKPDHPFAGAQVGIEDAKSQQRAIGAEVTLERMTAAKAEEAPALLKAAIERGMNYILLDVPPELYKSLAETAKGRDIILFNVSAPEDTLRRDVCARELIHVFPSQAQLSDALVQFLVSKKWRDYLVFQGPDPYDDLITKAFTKSAQKFGARIVANQRFEPGTDPRQREKNNPALLSAINKDWDVTFIADKAFEFSRQVPFQTVKPRPVVGAIGLETVAWNWTWEHNGAAQVNSRFSRYAPNRKMEGADWASWMAVKMIATSALRSRSTEFKPIRDFMMGPGTFDADKGLAVSVRAWDHQVRQAILLAGDYYVVASAPLEGFLHRTNELDSLGDDETDTPCHLNR